MASFVYNSSDSTARFGSQLLQTQQPLAGIDECLVRVMEWPSDIYATESSEAEAEKYSTVLTVSKLLARKKTKLRVIFAPLDIPSPRNLRGLHTLFSHFDIPAEFIAERLHSVTHSFGWHQEGDSSYVCWLHYLCKNIELVDDGSGLPSIRDPRGPTMSQDDGTWQRSGYFMRWKESVGAGGGDNGMVEFVIFSPSPSLQINLESLVPRSNWEDALVDPYCLLAIILDDMFRQLDAAISKVLAVFRRIEHGVLESAQGPESITQFDFVGIYNIAKHITYLKESSSAVYSTANRIADQHYELLAHPQRAHTSELMRGVQSLLQHKLSLLEGCTLRVQSLESRAQNVTNLAFNTVNQHDSHSLKSDSQSMKGIATMTMLFLPAATVAAICGSQFFNFDPDSHRIHVSTDFKFFWALALPLTVVVFAVYEFWRWLGGRSL